MHMQKTDKVFTSHQCEGSIAIQAKTKQSFLAKLRTENWFCTPSGCVQLKIVAKTWPTGKVGAFLYVFSLFLCLCDTYLSFLIQRLNSQVVRANVHNHPHLKSISWVWSPNGLPVFHCGIYPVFPIRKKETKINQNTLYTNWINHEDLLHRLQLIMFISIIQYERRQPLQTGASLSPIHLAHRGHPLDFSMGKIEDQNHFCGSHTLLPEALYPASLTYEPSRESISWSN